MKKMIIGMVILLIFIGCKKDAGFPLVEQEEKVEDVNNINNSNDENQISQNDDKEQISEVSEDNKEYNKIYVSKGIDESIIPSESDIFNENYELPKGYLKDVYWTGNQVLDQVLITHIIRSEENRNIFPDEIKSIYLSKEELNTINSYIESYELNMDDAEVKYWQSITYDQYFIIPFFTEYEDYIGIRSIIRIGEFSDLTSEEKYEYFLRNNTYEGKYIVDQVYYKKDENGFFIPDKQGYYEKKYEDKGCESIRYKEGELVFTNEFIDYSYSDYGSESRLNDSFVGYTKWSNDEVLNNALLAFIIFEYSFDKRLCEDYINNYLALSDAGMLNALNKSTRYYEAPFISYSEINVEYYDLEGVYLIKCKLGGEIPEMSSSMDSYLNNLDQSFYVIQKNDGKYKVLNRDEFLSLQNEMN